MTHPTRCIADLACLAGVGMSVLGWLPAVLACLASAAAAVHYGLQVYDRLRKGKPRVDA